MRSPSVCLVQAQMSSHENGLRYEKWYMPLGLLSIASVLQRNRVEEVVVFDADHDPEAVIVGRIRRDRPAILGINFNVFNTGLLDRVARAGRESDSVVIVGGQAATAIPARLLGSNSDIDAVVVYDGEEPMLAIARAVGSGSRDFSAIPNVVTRQAMNSFRFSTAPTAAPPAGVLMPALSSYPIIDRSVGELNRSRYFQSWNRPDIDPLRKATSIYFQKGCGRTCTFCARIDKSLRQRPARDILNEIRGLVAEGVNYLYVVDDTLSADARFLAAILAEARATGGDLPPFWAFADVRDLSEETMVLLAELGAEKLLIGIETGSEALRRKSGKMFTNDLLLRRLARLGSLGIKVEDSYVLGLPGESLATLAETMKLAGQVTSACQTEGTAFNIMTPLLGSSDWNRFMRVPALQRKYRNGYCFPVDEVRRDFLDAFCHLGGDGLGEAVALAERPSSPGLA
ncbi:MAG: B12-binding domain-containing radical SAM protein [Vicinamibacteria bacterium]|nr:B12-binding domain-containing radical SAM protein [Vicinamibacteria bacterium]